MPSYRKNWCQSKVRAVFFTNLDSNFWYRQERLSCFWSQISVLRAKVLYCNIDLKTVIGFQFSFQSNPTRPLKPDLQLENSQKPSVKGCA